MGCSATKQKVKIGDVHDLDLKVHGLGEKIGSNLKTILRTCSKIRRSIEAGQDDDYEQHFEDQVIQKLEKELEMTDFLAGDNYSVVDLVFFTEIQSIKQSASDLDRTTFPGHTPMLDIWYEKLANQDSIKLMSEHLSNVGDVSRRIPPREYA